MNRSYGDITNSSPLRQQVVERLATFHISSSTLNNAQVICIISFTVKSISIRDLLRFFASRGTLAGQAAHIIKAAEASYRASPQAPLLPFSCEGQTESGADTAVFKMEPGSTLKNVIIGKNQMEGVHCDKHDCILKKV
ncbi:Hypothetical protein PHPALM_2176 [Phytophthora palmivora]|uniref:Probable pectate lyase F n=1 Tax=Phytophthora palmivora TaxID=4796 RepID=A0A2P4YQF8_9STRA|nr:Hypothetical protein PHPALM_2176 [Phytophthora palmivora]